MQTDNRILEGNLNISDRSTPYTYRFTNQQLANGKHLVILLDRDKKQTDVFTFHTPVGLKKILTSALGLVPAHSGKESLLNQNKKIQILLK